jgi:hypothetical protein
MAVVIAGAVAAPIASAGTDGQGVGVEYPLGVSALKVCGNNQNKQWACTTPFGVPDGASTQSVWWVNGRMQPVPGPKPPSENPQWWFNGTVEVLMYNNAGAAYLPIPCNVPVSQSSNWWLCQALNPKLPTPPPPPPSPSPPPQPSPAPPPVSVPSPGPCVSGPSTPGVRLSLKAFRHRLRNKQWLHMRGTVTGLAEPGLVIALQGRVAGRGGWRAAGNAYVLPDGSFKPAYHFTQTFARTRYALRARLHSQCGYDGPTITSPAVHVVVRP